MTSNMFEPRKGIFKNVAPQTLRGWSNKWRWLRLETLKRTTLDRHRHTSQFFRTTNDSWLTYKFQKKEQQKSDSSTMSIHSFPIFYVNYKTPKIHIQLFQGIENISMSFIKSKICSTQVSTTLPNKTFKKVVKLDLTCSPGNELKCAG